MCTCSYCPASRFRVICILGRPRGRVLGKLLRIRDVQGARFDYTFRLIMLVRFDTSSGDIQAERDWIVIKERAFALGLMVGS
jgi:hypothetical protein